MEPSPPSGEYVVVARRYRPQTFDELIGQQHVAAALKNAIASNRVGHAYLFTGARGVGKTSAARILAKALNCQQGPTPDPCNQCDICQVVSVGEDVDVLEIDGASNRGIDEIRQLRQNVSIRPSRARFKIYIIDEVHMLTREAFNALLKTLEEPPEHVKFIFCTTEPQKLPVTVLSRCQRFDFAGIQTPAIVERLRQIVDQEGVAADDDALEMLARRAAGSMRDSQSLLEQLLSFCQERISAADVHHMLGTASGSRLTALLDHLVKRDAAALLTDLDAALAEGVDVGQLVQQLLGYLRDLMAASVGAADTLQFAAPDEQGTIIAVSQNLGTETILAMMQILDQTLSRMRVTTHRRILAELALVRLCSLENLEQLTAVISQLRGGETGPPPSDKTAPTSGEPRPTSGETRPTSGETETRPASGKPQPSSGQPGLSLSPPSRGQPPKKKSETEVTSHSPGVEGDQATSGGTALTTETARGVWKQALVRVEDMVADHAAKCDDIAILAPNRLVIHFQAQYSFSKSICERAEHAKKLENAVAQVVGSRVRLEFTVDASQAPQPGASAPRPLSQQERLKEKSAHPLVQRAIELFDAHPIRVEDSKKK